jgi:DNA-binding MarR family transcriptional regulator
MTPPSMKKYFVPLPRRAMTDPRLTALHWRVLAVIAAHDRLSKNGAGCWASQQRLADLAKCSYTRVSDTLTDLRTWGYNVTERHPTDERRRVHRIVYDDADRTVMDKNTSPNGELSAPYSNTSSSPKTRDSSPKRRSFSGQVVERTGGNQSKHMLRSIKKDKKEDDEVLEEANCAEARTSEGREATQAEQYLTACESLAASDDPDERQSLRFEIQKLTELADDPALPEHLCERAGRLLHVSETITRKRKGMG